MRNPVDRLTAGLPHPARVDDHLADERKPGRVLLQDVRRQRHARHLMPRRPQELLRCKPKRGIVNCMVLLHIRSTTTVHDILEPANLL